MLNKLGNGKGNEARIGKGYGNEKKPINVTDQRNGHPYCIHNRK